MVHPRTRSTSVRPGLRVLQGSHEESHRSQVHCLRWQPFRDRWDDDLVHPSGLVYRLDSVQRPLTAEHSGDHAYRTGVLTGTVGQGMWGILRVTDSGECEPDPTGPGVAAELGGNHVDEPLVDVPGR